MRTLIKILAVNLFLLPMAMADLNPELIPDLIPKKAETKIVKKEVCIRPVTVAVIDTGIDSQHAELTNYLWHDPKNKSVYGWDFTNDPKVGEMPESRFATLNDPAFVTLGQDFRNEGTALNEPVFVTLGQDIKNEGTANPIDNHGHGTHVSGIILQQSHCVRIMAIKYYSDSNTGPVNLRNTIKAIHYAIENKAKIINYSGGGPEPSEYELLALKEAERKGILVVAAAGNEHNNVELPNNAYYPAGYRLSNLIDVASVDSSNQLVSSSNWGKKKIDLAAYGDKIISTLPGSPHSYTKGTMSGTSQATAQVSGLAAALWGKNPSLTLKEVKNLILNNVLKVPDLKEKVLTGGILNPTLALAKVRPYKKEQRLPAAKEPTRSEKEIQLEKAHMRELLRRLKTEDLSN